jgi:hypothetical protein
MPAARVPLVAAAWLLTMGLLLASALVLVTSRYGRLAPEEAAWTIAFGAGYASVGALLVARRPNERIGPMAFGVGGLAVLSLALRALATTLDTIPGDPPAITAVVGGLAVVLQTAAVFAVAPLLIRFPDGRPERAGRLVDLTFIALVAIRSTALFVPGYLRFGWLQPIENPIGVPGMTAELVEGVGGPALIAYAATVALAVIGMIARYRRSGPLVRAQVRWVATAGAVQVVLFVPMVAAAYWLYTVWLLSTLLLPLAIGVAILRYHLYAIDRIIGRTISYALVSAVLAAVFVLSNLLLQAALVEATGAADTLTVAASTLLVATLFQPIRRRVQAPIDRRFSRSRTDAERVLRGFAQGARDEVDLGRLRTALVASVAEGVHPSSAQLWLRGTR